jgi:DNA-directed RNA polymerase specialized sigma24 family protein
VKAVLGRAAASAVRNGRPRTVAGWVGAWRARFRERGDNRFQGLDEPFPRHWRDGNPSAPAPLDTTHLGHAIEALPATWRAVLLARDAEHRSVEEVAAALGVTAAQQRRILTQARAAVRDGGLTP